MFHLALQEFDFVFGQVEQCVDAIVQLGFRIVDVASQAIDFGAFFIQIGLPLIGDTRVLQRVRSNVAAEPSC
jgi:hypothetical protein